MSLSRPLVPAAALAAALSAAAAASPTVLTFDGAPTGPTTGLEYVSQGVVLSSAAGTREFDFGGAVTEVLATGDWLTALEIRFVLPGSPEQDAVTTSVSMTNHFGPGGPGADTDHWTATSYDLAGNVLETKQLLGDGVLKLDAGAIHRVVLDDVNETAFAVDDLTFDPPSACGTTFGAGCPGTGGFVPSLFALGCGGATLSLTIDGALGGADAFLFLGTSTATLPMGGGCSLLVAPPVGPIGPLPLGGNGAGNGTTTLTVPSPPVPSTVTVHVQAFVSDAGGDVPFSNTAALSLTFSP